MYISTWQYPYVNTDKYKNIDKYLNINKQIAK